MIYKQFIAITSIASKLVEDRNIRSGVSIFVSYAESDGGDLAEKIKVFFEKNGYNVFVARRDIPFGEKWKIVIDTKLKQCKIFIVIATLGTQRSSYVDYEVNEAVRLNKLIIPCKHVKVDWTDIEWNIGEYEGVPSFNRAEDLLRELGPHILKNVGKMQGISNEMSVNLEKSDYIAGEMILVGGTVAGVIEGVPVAIRIFNPQNKMYTIGQPTPKADGTYSFGFKVGGNLGIDGTYTVVVEYAGQSLKRTFVLTGRTAVSLDTQKVEYQNNVFELKPTISNGTIHRIEVDPDFTSIVVFVSTTEDSDFVITLPRQLIDSRIGSMDDFFIVLIDGHQSRFIEIEKTSTRRTLKIPVPIHSEEIEIIGTVILAQEKEQENVTVVMISRGASNAGNPTYYVPKEVSIPIGTRVLWVNADSAGHTITSGNPSDSDFGSIFDSGFPLIKPASTFEFIFSKKGEYSYFCQVHPWEVGRIMVA